MWPSSRKTPRVSIAHDYVTLFECDKSDAERRPVKSEPLPDIPSLAGALECCLSSKTRATRAVHIIVSDVYARFWITTPPAHATTRQDLQMSSQWRFEDLFGESAAFWDLRADWHAGRPFVACALPLAITNAIAAVTSAKRVRILGCAPRFVAEWNAHRRELRGCSHAWFGVFADSVITVALIRRQEIDQIQRVRCPMSNQLDLGTLSVTLRSMALQGQDCCPERVMLCGDLPAQWEATRSGEFHFERIERSRLLTATIATNVATFAEQAQ